MLGLADDPAVVVSQRSTGWALQAVPACPTSTRRWEPRGRSPTRAKPVPLDYTDPARGLIATCQGPQGIGEVSLADLAFPPDTGTAWIHAAYRYHLRLPPFPARPRPDWTWPT